MTLNQSLSQLVLAASMVLVAMAISTWQHLGLTKSLAIGAVRGTVQLIFMGLRPCDGFSNQRTVAYWLFNGFDGDFGRAHSGRTTKGKQR